MSKERDDDKDKGQGSHPHGRPDDAPDTQNADTPEPQQPPPTDPGGGATNQGPL